MKKILLFASLLAMSFGASAAAVSPTTLTGSSAGSFTSATGPSNDFINGVGTNNLTWGDGAVISRSCVLWWCKEKTSDPSRLTYTGETFTAQTDEIVTVGKFEFFNGTIKAGTEATSATFDLSLDFTTPFSDNSTFSYAFALENTPNPQGDSVILLGAGDPSKLFSYEGKDYYFTLLGFQVGSNIIDEIFLKELKKGTFKLVGQFTTLPSEVPLPAAVWLLGSGLMGFMAMRRRATKAQQAA